MKSFIYFIAFLSFVPLCAQESLPGGVKGITVWEIAEASQAGMTRFRSALKDSPSQGFNVTGKTKSINNNQALCFTDGSNTVNSTLDLGKLQSFSLFTVCQETDTTLEKIIVSLENDSTAEMSFTDRRIAALDMYRYASFNGGINLFPRIYAYTRNSSSDTIPMSRKLRLGRPPLNQRLPVGIFNGIIPEIILFNRILSPRERQQVESYLAIKYGISLNQEFPVSYLNSHGSVIWDAELNRTFNSNLAGIGKDSLSGLNQRISESSQTPGLMKIGAVHELKDNTFLVWGDNGKPPSLAEGSGFRKLLKDWKISAYNVKGDYLCFETDMMALNEIKPLREGEIFWLMTDRSGTGKYPFGQTDFISCQPLSRADKITRFTPVAVDPDHSGADVFTLVAAPPFFVRSVVLPPSCQLEQSGSIEAEIAGGDPPFSIMLTGISDSRFHSASRESSRSHIFTDISQGAYLLKITDSNNKTFSEKIWVSNSTPWDTRLADSYTLAGGKAITLNASEGTPGNGLVYSWVLPDGTQLNSETISISQPGLYLLSVTDAGNCNSTRTITIKQSGESDFRLVDLFPNPAIGLFTLRMMLEKEMDVNIITTDIKGKNLKQVMVRNERFYSYSDVISTPGIYFITLLSKKEKVTLKLIVE